ncbi:MAG TPA: 5-oxoprolinase subunit PxpB [Desulfobacterales bacterium]|nr:5-oxoprolinase subunit PxpB [Desulfobacterales bacterium]
MPPTGLYDRARFRVSGERCLLAEYGGGVDLATNDKVRRMAASILQHRRPGIEGVVPSYSTLAVLYDPIQIDFSILTQWLWELEAGLDRARLPQPRIVEIPVSYGGAFGPDIAFVAAHNQIGVPEVVEIHSRTTYPIYAVGFAPGFCYLGGLDPRLHTPRLETPRTRVPAGSVGIAGAQTGVYPQASPGGWRLIGRTPLRLFAPERPAPVLYQAGDKIRFRAISEAEFRDLSRREAAR